MEIYRREVIEIAPGLDAILRLMLPLCMLPRCEYDALSQLDFSYLYVACYNKILSSMVAKESEN